MKKNMILVAAIDDDGVEQVVDALDLDERSFRSFVLGTLWNAGVLAGVNPGDLPGADIAMRIKPGATPVMTLAEANRRNEEAEAAAKAAAEQQQDGGSAPAVQ
jgi:hypothetical protein